MHAVWRRNHLVVVLVTLVGFTGFTLVMPFLALYVRDLGAADGEIALWTGLALGVTPAVSALVAPFWGRLADRVGNKLLVQRSLLSFVVVMVWMAYVTKPWHLFVLRAVQGLVAGYGSMTLSMVARQAPRERMAEAIGTLQTAQRIGPAIGPVLGGLLASAVGLRQAFFVAAGVYAVALLALTVFYTEPPRTGSPGDGPRPPRLTFREILAFDNIVVLVVVIGLLNVVDRLFGPVLPLHVSRLGLGEEAVPLAAGLLFSVLALTSACGHALAAVLLRRQAARVVIAGSVLLAGITLIGIAAAATMWPLTAAVAAFGLALGTASTAAFASAGTSMPTRVHGAGFGVLTSASLIGSAVSPMLAGVIGARSIRGVFVAGALALGALAVFVQRTMIEGRRL